MVLFGVGGFISLFGTGTVYPPTMCSGPYVRHPCQPHRRSQVAIVFSSFLRPALRALRSRSVCSVGSRDLRRQHPRLAFESAADTEVLLRVEDPERRRTGVVGKVTKSGRSLSRTLLPLSKSFRMICGSSSVRIWWRGTAWIRCRTRLHHATNLLATSQPW